MSQEDNNEYPVISDRDLIPGIYLKKIKEYSNVTINNVLKNFLKGNAVPDALYDYVIRIRDRDYYKDEDIPTLFDIVYALLDTDESRAYYRVFTNTRGSKESVSVYLSNSELVEGQSSGFYPVPNDTLSLGKANNLWTQEYAKTPNISTADARNHQGAVEFSDAFLALWENVKIKYFKFADEAETLGNNAKFHCGFEAQDIASVLGSQVNNYSFFVYDSWPEEDYDEIVLDRPAKTRSVVIVDKPAVYDDKGRLVEPAVTHRETITVSEAVTHTEHHHVDAGDLYSLRLEEALCIEADYHRYEIRRLREYIARLEARIARLEQLV